MSRIHSQEGHMDFAAEPERHTIPGRRPRAVGPWLVDAAAWALGLSAAIVARYDLDLAAAPLTATAVAVVIAIILHSAIGHQQFLYRGRYGFGTFEEVRAVF